MSLIVSLGHSPPCPSKLTVAQPKIGDAILVLCASTGEWTTAIVRAVRETVQVRLMVRFPVLVNSLPLYTFSCYWLPSLSPQGKLEVQYDAPTGVHTIQYTRAGPQVVRPVPQNLDEARDESGWARNGPRRGRSNHGPR